MNNVSVCMATYNGEKYIRRQLLSILSQLSPYDEVIISDDGSNDGTIDVITQLADRRIRLNKNTGRLGPLGNFEHAIRQARHGLVLLADQDDIWLPNKVKEVRLLLQTNDLVLSDCQVVDENGKVIHKSFFKYRGSRPGFLYNLYKNSYIGCCMAFRREVLEYVLPFPSQVHMHDWWIGLLVEAKGNVCFFSEPLIQYVRHGSNASPTGDGGYGYARRLKNRIILVFHIIKRLFS